jgi:hypothetical protein
MTRLLVLLCAALLAGAAVSVPAASADWHDDHPEWTGDGDWSGDGVPDGAEGDAPAEPYVPWNKIIGKPYKWGRGHARLFDSGYDCSGSVSFALIRSGLLGSPLVSGTYARWGAAGAGRSVTIFANRGHVYMEVAGLRLDTSSVGDWGGKHGVRWRPLIGKRKGFRVRHIAGL